MIHRTILAAAAGCLLAGTVVAAQSRAERQMNADLRMLQQQTQQLQVLLDTLTGALQAVSQKLDAQADTDRKAFADMKLLTDTISGEVRVVREKLDEANVRLGSFGQEIQAVQMAIQTLRLQIPPPVPEGEVPATAAGGAVGVPSPDSRAAIPLPPALSLPLGVEPTRMFESARTDYLAGQYSLSVKGFEAYLRTFPTLTQAGEAQYYIGENLRSDGQTEAALAAYDKVITNYPQSDAMAKARYRRAEMLQTLGRGDAAKEEYERVVAGYPDSSEARLARQRLDGLLRPPQ